MNIYIKAERRASYNASLKAYQASNPSPTSHAPVRRDMLSHDGELITKEKFAALFAEAWKAKLQETRGQR